MERRRYRFAAGAATVLVAASDVPAPAPFTQTLPATTVTLEMVPVPGADGISPFWMGRTEVTWDLYDVFVYGLDEPRQNPAGAGGGADAVARPSKPYISMDRGFGHNGYPAISVSHRGAEAFCQWLSARSGRRYRLPAESEWRHACARGGITAESAPEHAWLRPAARHATHPVAQKAPDAAGLCDMWGDAAEWVIGSDGAPLVMGGSYRDDPEHAGCAAAVPSSDRWNASDPQVPKSVWWLADGGFIGFRVVCEEQ